MLCVLVLMPVSCMRQPDVKSDEAVSAMNCCSAAYSCVASRFPRTPSNACTTSSSSSTVFRAMKCVFSTHGPAYPVSMRKIVRNVRIRVSRRSVDVLESVNRACGAGCGDGRIGRGSVPDCQQHPDDDRE